MNAFAKLQSCSPLLAASTAVLIQEEPPSKNSEPWYGPWYKKATARAIAANSATPEMREALKAWKKLTPAQRRAAAR